MYVEDAPFIHPSETSRPVYKSGTWVYFKFNIHFIFIIHFKIDSFDIYVIILSWSGFRLMGEYTKG